MEYYKQEGGHITTYYRLNVSANEMLILDLRYDKPSVQENRNLETIYSSNYTGEEYTEQNVFAIRRYESISKKEFTKAQREASEWIKRQGE